MTFNRSRIKEDSPTLNIPERLSSAGYGLPVPVSYSYTLLEHKRFLLPFFVQGTSHPRSGSETGAELQNESSATVSALCCLLFPCLCLQAKTRSSPIYVAICMQIRGYFQMCSASCRRQAAFKNVGFPRMIVRFSVSILLFLYLLADLFLTLIYKCFKA